ncbi:hypothetical protein [Wenjunlia tyrosinilytica]|uniref:Uncharacterized protein n=1 Tax=Wenjunlia tyrosinilytica TaxID=1544741 RepID=A0A918E0Z3_9ACTN|nr:hypothetical protein GCM10012280_49670 [Wenjunlia tyrosinilytica]
MSSALDREVIAELAAGIEEELIELRREIHRHPELAGDEWRTSVLVADRLRAAGLAVWTGVGGHGVVAVLDGAGAGPTVAYRADMDAVDDEELFDTDFAYSRRPDQGRLLQFAGRGRLAPHRRDRDRRRPRTALVGLRSCPRRPARQRRA